MQATFPSMSCDNFNAIEELEPAPNIEEEGLQKVRLHPRSGRASDFTVHYNTQGKATHAWSCSALKRFMSCCTVQAQMSMGICMYLNDKADNSGPCHLNLSTRSDLPSPQSIREWLACAQLPVSASNKALTLIVDLDNTLLFSNPSPIPQRFSNKHELSFAMTGSFYTDAMLQIKAFQKLGHNVLVLTDADYPETYISAAFKHYGIELGVHRYINRDSNLRRTTKAEGYDSKTAFLKRYGSGKHCLMVDDLLSNKSSKTHFYHVTPSSHFPELNTAAKQKFQANTA